MALLFHMVVHCVPAWAQKTFQWGLTAGVNNNSLHLAQLPNYTKLTTLWSYNAGLSFTHALTRKFNLAYSLLYSRQGGAIIRISPLGLGDYQTNTLTDYLTLPLMVRYRVSGGRLWLGAGPQLGYLLRAESYSPQLGETATETGDLPYYHRLDIGLVAGLGYQFSKHFGVSSQYYVSERFINKPDPQTGIYGVGALKVSGQVWSTNLVYYFK